MTTYRIKKHVRDFTQVQNATLRDVRLSFKARGVLVWLLSHVDTWEASRAQIARNGTEGVDAIKSAENELKALGYLERIQEHRPDGTFAWITNVYETPGGTIDGLSTDGSAIDGSAIDGQSLPIEDHHSEDDVEENDLELLVAPSEALFTLPTIKFETWYSRWPKKQGKAIAAEKWKTLSHDERLASMAALPGWEALAQADGNTFIPQANTFIHQQRWLDEAPTPSKPKPDRHSSSQDAIARFRQRHDNQYGELEA